MENIINKAIAVLSAIREDWRIMYMNKVVDILMKCDGLDESEALSLIDECREALEEGDSEAIQYYLGLEDDYIFDVLGW